MSAGPVLVDRFGRPYAAPAAGRLGAVARVAGSGHGTMASWYPRRHGGNPAARERELVARRAEDLVANDAHAAGLVDSLAVNVVGTGLVPQSQVDGRRLGIGNGDVVAELRNGIESAFAAWAVHADAGGRMNFDQMQHLVMRTTLVQGEYLNLCVSMAGPDGGLPPGRSLALALQSLSPQRLRTPCDRWLSPGLRDGVELGRFGEPVAYYIAQPDDAGLLGLTGESVRYPARVAHRPVVLHGFPQREPEQWRGWPVLAPAMKFFRDLSDCLDYELVGQLVTAAFPLAIESEVRPFAENGYDPRALPLRPWDDRVAGVDGGSVLHLYPGERAHVLDAPRPGSNFDAFVERILRAAGAAAGLPYEVVVKDFSKTNYSSARAALLEAWRVFRLYQQWLLADYCLPVWRAVVEEAFARGLVVLPPGAPDFYEAMEAYLAVSWIPPRQGHVDPVKEIEADIAALEAGVTTYAEVIAARGGDYETTFRQQRRERDLLERLGLPDPARSGTVRDGKAAAPSPEQEDQ